MNIPKKMPCQEYPWLASFDNQDMDMWMELLLKRIVKGRLGLPGNQSFRSSGYRSAFCQGFFSESCE
jgi:hypothetical protein